jgi:light-regulated signal transduction histidine kinase (bacteriophytochrome)
VLDELGGALTEESRRYLNTIRTNTVRMRRLIDDLLQFSRLGRQPIERRPVDVSALVRDTLAELAPQRAGRNVELRVGNLPPCHGDPSMLRQVWVNLLSNAFKYTRGRDPAVIEIGGQRVNGRCSYYVRDNGAGFDMRHRNHIFGVFQRVHREEEFDGTGVGLAIVHRIVTRHGGRVEGEGEPGKGATFRFEL